MGQDGSQDVEVPAAAAAAQVSHAPPRALPLELLPGILHQVHAANRLQDLAACARVSKTWNKWATPKLWYRLWLRDHRRLRPVFATLRRNPHLCRLVRILELRVYPLGLMAEELERLEDDIAAVLAEMTNLQELSWTRTGSLSNRLLPFLVANKAKLSVLELTGNTKAWSTALPMLWCPNPQAASGQPTQDPLPNLQSLSFILPDTGAIQALIEIAKRRKLKSINLLCQSSSVLLPIHADLLCTTDPDNDWTTSLSDLERLVLVGCKRVDGESVRKLVKASRCGLRTLSLEGCSAVSGNLGALLTTREV